jgi:hypothetical protein
MKATMPRAIDAAAWKSQDFSNTLLEVFWLLRGLTPDLKTIADFRKDNRGAFKLVFRQFVLLCRKLELFGGGRFEAFSTDVKDRSRKSRFSTFEWRSEFFIACGYSISWES